MSTEERAFSPENIVIAQHKTWLAHPTTVQMFKNLEKQKKFLVGVLANTSPDTSVPDTFFRLTAHSIKMIDNLVQQTRNTDLFIQQTEKKD